MRSLSKDDKSLIWIALSELHSCEKRYKLANYCNSPEELFDRFGEYIEELTEEFGKNLVDRLKSNHSLETIDGYIDKCEHYGVEVITINDDDYPDNLRQIECPPILLHCVGNSELLKTPMIGVVGSRNATEYGRSVTEKFVREFCASGLTIVSGIAYGVDAFAHRAALKFGGKTIAVLPCGQDIVYPQENASLYREVEQKGLKISEYLLGVEVQKYTFAARNRIISGLAEALFVPEAKKTGGTHITIDCAIAQSKSVFAVPGSILSPLSQGCNRLIKEEKAYCALEPSDVLEALGYDKRQNIKTQNEAHQLSLEENVIIDLLEQGEMHYEELLTKSGFTTSALSVLLTKLEVLGIIRSLDGNYYCKY